MRLLFLRIQIYLILAFASMKEISMDQWIFYASLLLLLPILISFLCKKLSPSKIPSLPPGPRPWPIIGNLHQIGLNAHISLTHFSKTYGPLISLKLGSQLLVVASSPSSATEILKTHDRILSGRYIFKMSMPENRPLSLLFSPQCDDNWKSLRSICRSGLFTAKAIESQSGLRKKKMGEMVEYLRSKQGETVKIKEIIFITIFNTLSNLIFSRDFLGFEGEIIGGIKESMQKMMDLGLVPNLADFYPVLEDFDLQGLRKKAFLLLKEITSSFAELMDERRRQGSRKKDGSERDFLDVLMESRVSDAQIKMLILEVLSAGIDTTTTTLEWAMAELIANKEIMHRVRAEIERETKAGAIIDEAKLPQLHYLQACVKETLRLHPPAPFLLPRQASEDCEVMGYRIPKNTRIFINVWAIGRDPEIWEEATAFKPERFMGSEMELRDQNYEFLPFGGGRRLCPGMGMASVQAPLLLATLLQSFDWRLPGEEDPSSPGFLNGKLGITLQKENPLLLIPQPLTTS